MTYLPFLTPVRVVGASPGTPGLTGGPVFLHVDESRDTDVSNSVHFVQYQGTRTHEFEGELLPAVLILRAACSGQISMSGRWRRLRCNTDAGPWARPKN